MGAREKIVIVGNGMVGLKFTEELSSRAGDRFDITMIGAEPDPAYNRVLLSALLAGEVTEEECRFRDRDWYSAQGIALVTGARATAIDTTSRTLIVENASGASTLPFDKLVLATGSDAIRLPTTGMDLPQVFTFRDMADYAAIRDAGSAGRKAVVIGGGLLGLEAAFGLVRRGVETTLIHIMDRLMERQLDAHAAALVKAAMEAKGITVLLGANTAKVLGDENVTGIALADGRVLDCDLVVVAVGVRPSSALAKTAGLAVGRGVTVNDGMETSVPGIYAIGECAEHRGIAYGLVEPGYDQARVLARRLTGETASYAGTTLATNLKVSGLPVFSAGVIEDGPDTITLTDAAMGHYRKFVFEGERLAGAVLVGDTADGLWYLDLIRSGRPIPGRRGDIAFGRAFVSEAA